MLEISPEPTPEEREVIEHVLARIWPEPDRRDPWWEAGARDATEPDDDSGEPSVS